MTAAQSTARESGMALGLGTVPDYVRTVLADHGLLGCMVEWFAHVDDSPNAGDPYADPEHAGQQADDHADNHQHHHAVRRFIQPTRIRPE